MGCISLDNSDRDPFGAGIRSAIARESRPHPARSDGGPLDKSPAQERGRTEPNTSESDPPGTGPSPQGIFTRHVELGAARSSTRARSLFSRVGTAPKLTARSSAAALPDRAATGRSPAANPHAACGASGDVASGPWSPPAPGRGNLLRSKSVSWRAVRDSDGGAFEGGPLRLGCVRARAACPTDAGPLQLEYRSLRLSPLRVRGWRVSWIDERRQHEKRISHAFHARCMASRARRSAPWARRPSGGTRAGRPGETEARERGRSWRMSRRCQRCSTAGRR